MFIFFPSPNAPQGCLVEQQFPWQLIPVDSCFSLDPVGGEQVLRGAWRTWMVFGPGRIELPTTKGTYRSVGPLPRVGGGVAKLTCLSRVGS